MLPFHFTSGYRKFTSYWWRHYLLPKTWYRPFQIVWQRSTRGYADCDLWALDGWLGEIMPSALTQLKREKQGVPFGIPENEWSEQMNLMIAGFQAAHEIDTEHSCDMFFKPRDSEVVKAEREQAKIDAEGTCYIRYVSENDFDRDGYNKLHSERIKTFEIGMDAFKKGFFGLWD